MARSKKSSKMETINRILNGFIVEKKPKSVTAEAYRTLRTNIQYSSFDKKIKAIVVTSAEAGEGKSTVAGNLALSFSQNEKKVIVVDCDLRRPTVHKGFRVSNLVGLSEVIIGKAKLKDAIQKYNENLDILPSGKIPPNPSEMLSSATMANLIKYLKEIYDVIIIDSSPILAVTDAQILSTEADGTLLVVRAGRTKNDSVIEAKNLLTKVGANIIGSVLHGAERSRSIYKYSYYGLNEESTKG